MASRPSLRRRSTLVLVFLTASLLLFFAYDPEPSFHPRPTGIRVSARARALHDDAIVIDLHVDSLLWPRDLTLSEQGGQLDFERMRRGGLDAAAFTLPTAFFGLAGLKAFHDRWPLATWFSRWERLIYQLGKMRSWIEEDAIGLATTADGIRRNHDRGALSAFHGIEGAHALERDVRRVGEVARRGVVFIGPVHLADNDYGGSSSGTDRGLTELGRDLIREMNREGVLLDLAHASPATFEEAIALTELPPLVSHTGVRGVNDSWRNLSDAQIRAVARRGGVIGIMLAPPALHEPSLEEALRHIEHVIEIAGEDAVALGSDFDGYVSPPIDAAGLPALTELMLEHDYSEERVRKILGENALRILTPAPVTHRH